MRIFYDSRIDINRSPTDLISIPLISIVLPCCVRAPRVVDYSLHYFLELFICCVLVEPFLNELPVEFLKAFHSFAMCHHHYGVHYLFFVLSDVFQTEKEESFEVFEDIGVRSLHYVDVILSEFERSFLKTEIAWAARNYEAKIDVDYVSVHVYEYIVVVAIFNLK